MLEIDHAVSGDVDVGPEAPGQHMSHQGAVVQEVGVQDAVHRMSRRERLKELADGPVCLLLAGQPFLVGARCEK